MIPSRPPHGRWARADPHIAAEAFQGTAPTLVSLLPYLFNLDGDEIDGWNGFDLNKDFGEFHACYYIWGGRAWLQGTLEWNGLAPTYENDAADIPITGTPLPPEIRPETTQMVRLWEDDVNVTDLPRGDGVLYWDTFVNPDGSWEIIPRDIDPIWPKVGTANVLDGVNWPIGTLRNPTGAELDLTTVLHEQFIAGPGGARLIQGAGRIRGEGSIISAEDDARFITLDLPAEWWPVRMVQPAELLIGNKGDPIERKQILIGGDFGYWLSHVNALVDPSPPGQWSLSSSNPPGPLFAGTEFSLEQVSWLGGEAGFASIPGEVRAGTPQRGMVPRHGVGRPA